jgi:hypothetical protein
MAPDFLTFVLIHSLGTKPAVSQSITPTVLVVASQIIFFGVHIAVVKYKSRTVHSQVNTLFAEGFTAGVRVLFVS